jgi:transcriptional regulator with XRE-family HTH domain
MKHLPLTESQHSGDNSSDANFRDGVNVDESFVKMYAAMRMVHKENGWTQRRLCAALGRSDAWLSKILHAGRGMDVADLIRICEVTGIPPEKLLAGYPCKRNDGSESEQIAKRLKELLPADILKALLEIGELKT